MHCSATYMYNVQLGELYSKSQFPISKNITLNLNAPYTNAPCMLNIQRNSPSYNFEQTNHPSLNKKKNLLFCKEKFKQNLPQIFYVIRECSLHRVVPTSPRFAVGLLSLI